VGRAHLSRASRYFPRALGIIYLIAFVSFGIQASGLIGSRGILPLENYLLAVRREMGPRAFWYVPTVFWVNASDFALRLASIAGAVLAMVLILGYWRRASLCLLFVLYLSISTAGQDFWSFQWDILLTEAGFLAIFLDGTAGRAWLFRWLLFRLMFMSGMAKLLSGDSAWRDFTALSYHYLTQPLPTPIAWYLYQLPLWFHKVSTGFTLLAELVVPFLIFAPRRFRRTGAATLVGLQVLILLSGNYTFFNLLTIALCLFLVWPDSTQNTARESRMHRIATLALWAFVGFTSGLELLDMFPYPLPSPARAYLRWLSPLRIVNSYGLFAVMTTTRPEIQVEGSADGETWLPYEFRYKPGDVRRAPPWVAPYQPRLDWQMWFAALGNPQQNPWLYSFAARLMEGSPPVLGLLEHNPFPAAPPRYIRAIVYDYQFTNFAERRASGAWWRRRQIATYMAPVSLRSQ